MAVRSNEKRQVGVERDYPGSYGWPIYQYLCCECGRWGECSDTERVNDDGTFSPICPECAAKIPLEDA